MQRTLLALFAHPDDEGFFAGGTLAHYANRGVRVVLGCATRGEAGSVQSDEACCPEDLGQAREKELRCACSILGIQELRFLDYRDSGIAGDPANQDPRAFIQADAEQVVTKILHLFREFRPQVVLTFGPDGGYGHPDHVAMHDHTMAAWQRSDAPDAPPDLIQNPPRKLYFTARPRSHFRRLREEMWRRGLYPEPPSEEVLNRRSVPDEQVTTTINVTDSIETRFRALRCHRTQVGPNSRWMRLPEDVRQQHFSLEFFTLAAVRGLEIRFEERDLFAGLELPKDPYHLS